MNAHDKGEAAVSKSAAKRPYPGATLRYLGSVRDVTLAKTRRAPEGAGFLHT